MKNLTKEENLKFRKQKPMQLRYLDEDEQNDKDLVKFCVSIDPCDFKFASKELKNDKEFVSELVEIHPYTLNFASEDLKNDKEFISELSEKNIIVARYAGQALCKDKEFSLSQIAKDPDFYDCISDTLKKDSDIALVAVTVLPSLITIFDKSLQNNKEILSASINSDGYFLQFGSDELRNDSELILKANTIGIKQHELYQTSGVTIKSMHYRGIINEFNFASQYASITSLDGDVVYFSNDIFDMLTGLEVTFDIIIDNNCLIATNIKKIFDKDLHLYNDHQLESKKFKEPSKLDDLINIAKQTIDIRNSEKNNDTRKLKEIQIKNNRDL